MNTQKPTKLGLLRVLNNHTWLRESKMVKGRDKDRQMEAADNAEGKVCSLVTKWGWKCHKGIRIPNLDRSIGKLEIDSIAITDKGIYLIEVKNFVGKVSIDGQMLKQNDKIRGDVFGTLEKKVEIFKRIVLNLTGNPDIDVKGLLVFPNRKVELSDELKARKDVSDLKGLRKMIDHFNGHFSKLTAEESKMINETIPSFGTWDELHWNEDYLQRGDLNVESLGLGLKRDDFKSITVENSRGYWTSLLFGPKITIRVMAKDGLVLVERELNGNEIMEFHITGQKSISFIPTSHIRSLSLGYLDSDGMKLRTRTKQVKSARSNRKGKQAKRGRQNNPNLANDAWKKFKPGDVADGTILERWDYGDLIELDAKGIKGLLKNRTFETEISLMMYQGTHSKGKPVKVKIIKSVSNKEIHLKLA